MSLFRTGSSQSMAVAAIANFGLAMPEKIENWRRLQDECRDNPGATGAIAFGEALAPKP